MVQRKERKETIKASYTTGVARKLHYRRCEKATND